MSTITKKEFKCITCGRDISWGHECAICQNQREQVEKKQRKQDSQKAAEVMKRFKKVFNQIK